MFFQKLDVASQVSDILRNREFASQLKIFAGMKWGRISPTDIDGFLDFGDRLFVFIEVKHGKSMPPTGQRIALERLCDACESKNRASVAIVATHSTSDDIHIKDLPVHSYRWRRKWRIPASQITVHKAIDIFLGMSGIIT